MKTKLLLALTLLLLAGAAGVIAQSFNAVPPAEQRLNLLKMRATVGRTAPEPAPAGRFQLVPATVNISTSTGAIPNYQTLFKLDTATGRTWILVIVHRPGEGISRNWVEFLNQEDEGLISGFTEAIKQLDQQASDREVDRKLEQATKAIEATKAIQPPLLPGK